MLLRSGLIALALLASLLLAVSFTSYASAAPAAPTAVNCDELPQDFSALYKDAHCQGNVVELGSEGFISLVGLDVPPGTASSLKLKAGTSARLYSGTGESGSFICLRDTTRDFATENFWRAGGALDNAVGSLVFYNDDKCGWPSIPQLFNPTGAISTTTAITLSWQEVFAGSYVAELIGPNGTITSGVKIETHWALGTLPAGQYSWKVQGEVFGYKAEWTSFATFTVTGMIDPEPAQDCNATTTQITVFETADCKGEKMQITSDGYQSLGQLSNKASAIIIPAGKSARLYHGVDANLQFVCIRSTIADFSSERFWRNGSPLDNGTDGIQGFDDDKCGWPSIPQLFNPTGAISTTTAITLSWQEVFAGSYVAELIGPNGTITSGVKIETHWALGTLPAGQYSWKVQGEVFGYKAEWTSFATFTVTAPVLPPTSDCNSVTGNRVLLFPEKNCKGSPLQINSFGKVNLTGSDFEANVGSMYVPEKTSVRVFDQVWEGLTNFYTTTMWDLRNDMYWQSDVKVGSSVSSLIVYGNAEGLEYIYLPLINR